jgi:peptide/nickel transport system substrate-binding protein
MKIPSSCFTRWSWLLAFVLWIGCSSGNDSATKPAETDADNSTATTEAEAAAAEQGESVSDKPFQLGDLIKPFDPPPLEELEKSVEWVDRPVLDSLTMMRDHQAEQGPPPLTVAEALALRNESREDNEKILGTLGRVAPEDGAGVDFESEIVMVADGDLKSSNPLLYSSVTEFDYQALTGFGLFGANWKLEFFGSKDALVSWQSSKDHLMEKVVLRGDLTWSDGKPITAHDVEFSFKVIMSDAVIIPAVRQGTDQLKYVKAYDDHTVVFFHKEALASNDSNITFPIIPKHIYESTVPADPTMTRSGAHSKLEDNPVVGGAYTLRQRTRGQEFVVERRESYFMHNGRQVRDKPYFKTFRFKVIEDRNTALLALKAGRVDELLLFADQWQGQTNGDDFYQRNTKISGEEWTSFHFCWNNKTPYFEDKRVRLAMAYAMDYQEMLQTIYHGLYDPGRGNFHPNSWMFPKDGPQPFQQDLNKAEDLLTEAGWADTDGDGVRDKTIGGQVVPFEFTLLCAPFDDRIQTCTLLKECLENIGIVCHVKPTEFTVLTQLLTDHNFQAALGGWGSGVDPDTSANIWVTGQPRNYGQYSNPRVDELFIAGRREFNRDKRAQIYGEIHKILWNDQPNTWLFSRNSFYAFNKKLRGYNFSPRGPFHYSPGISSIFAAAEMP